jgi:MFS transporter, PAT family, beta-lactamase induction signal transducer AmpG
MRARTGGWLDAVRVYGQPRMLSMLALGFSSGLPFMLIYSTLSAWLRQAGIERATIGMLSWVSLVYTLKFLWAPVVDRLRLPLIGALLGQRRSWMLLAQAGIASALIALSGSDPSTRVAHMALLALLLAFAAATQDVAIDAWRIESAPVREQGAMAAAYQLGYRLAILTGSAGALWIAADLGWARSYATMAALVAVGVVTTLLVREPERIAPPLSVLTEQRVIDWLARRGHWPPALRHAGAWSLGAVLCPVLDFFARYGAALGLLIFAFIGSYRLTDYTMGAMANPFYLDLGFTLKQIAAVVKIYGTLLSVAGILIGGLAVVRLGRTRSLLLGSVLVMISNVSFSILAAHGEPSVAGLATVISLDNFAQGVHGTALIAFMSSLTSASYTATQYAVLSSLYALPGKLLMGTSGIVVDHVGYPSFFLYTAALSIPALVVLYLLSRRADFAPLRTRAAA